MKMPAKSVQAKAAETAALDRIALPLIAKGMSIEDAYKQALQSPEWPPRLAGWPPR